MKIINQTGQSRLIFQMALPHLIISIALTKPDFTRHSACSVPQKIILSLLHYSPTFCLNSKNLSFLSWQYCTKSVILCLNYI